MNQRIRRLFWANIAFGVTAATSFILCVVLLLTLPTVGLLVLAAVIALIVFERRSKKKFIQLIPVARALYAEANDLTREDVAHLETLDASVAMMRYERSFWIFLPAVFLPLFIVLTLSTDSAVSLVTLGGTLVAGAFRLAWITRKIRRAEEELRRRGLPSRSGLDSFDRSSGVIGDIWSY